MIGCEAGGLGAPVGRFAAQQVVPAPDSLTRTALRLACNRPYSLERTDAKLATCRYYWSMCATRNACASSITVAIALAWGIPVTVE